VDTAWKITSNIIDSWDKHRPKNLPVYEAGTWGPEGMDEFIDRDGRAWRRLS